MMKIKMMMIFLLPIYISAVLTAITDGDNDASEQLP